MDENLKSRADAKHKFTRKVNLLKDAHARDDPLQALKDIYHEVCEQFDRVEEINDTMVNSLDTKDESYDSLVNDLELYIMDVERVKNDVHAMVVKSENCGNSSVTDLPKTRMQRLNPPHFDGKIRECCTFSKDYVRLMKPVYGDDPYAFVPACQGKHWKSFVE